MVRALPGDAMRLRDWRSPIEGLDMGRCQAIHGGRGGVMATEGQPPKVPAGLGHTHGQWEAHKERLARKRRLDRERYAAAKAAAG